MTLRQNSRVGRRGQQRFQAIRQRPGDKGELTRILNDLRSPAGNRLERLRKNLAGMYSIRVNDQWRIILRFEDGNAFDVRIADYH